MRTSEVTQQNVFIQQKVISLAFPVDNSPSFMFPQKHELRFDHFHDISSGFFR